MGKFFVVSGLASIAGAPRASLVPLSVPAAWSPASLGAALVAWYESDQGITAASGTISAITGVPISGTATGPALASPSGQGLSLVQNTFGSLPGFGNTLGNCYAASSGMGLAGLTCATPFSLAIAFQKAAGSSQYGQLLSIGDVLHGFLFGFFHQRQSNGSVTFSLDGNGDLTVSSTTIPTAGQKLSLVVTYDGSLTPAGVKFYINGVADPTVTLLNTMHTENGQMNSGPLTIGSTYSNNTDEEDLIGSVLIANRVLTSTEAALLSTYHHSKYSF